MWKLILIICAVNLNIGFNEFENFQNNSKDFQNNREDSEERITEKSLKYIWAINGLNLRESPSTKSKIIQSISFGESLEIIETTDKIYVNKLVQIGGEEKHPILLKSNWVKVMFKDKIGFIIDGYLMEVKTPLKNELPNEYLKRISQKYGYTKLMREYKIEYGKLIFNSHQVEISKSKSVSFELEENKGNTDSSVVEMIWYFKGFSTNEILIFMNPFFDIEDNGKNQYTVHKNWKDKIIIYNDTDEIRLNKMNNEEIIFYFTTSC